MKIMHVVSSAGFYGVESMLVTLAGEHTRCGVTSIVAAFVDARSEHTEVLDVAQQIGLEVSAIQCRGRYDARASGEIHSICCRHRIDLLHTHGYKADFYGYRATSRSGLPVVSTAHNWPNTLPRMRVYAALDRFLLRSFDGVAAVSDTVADRLRRAGVPKDRIKTIWNGVDVDRFERARAGVRAEAGWANRPVIGFVGRLAPEKGGAILLAAARTVLEHVPEALFAFIGDGPSGPEWQRLAKRLGVEENVAFLGTRRDMPEVYSSLDVLVLPSFDEGSPIAVLEAMAAHKAVIATRVGGLPALITPGLNGVLIEPADPNALAAATLALLRNEHLRKTLGDRANLCVAHRFSAAAMAASYLEFYEQALRRRQRRIQSDQMRAAG
jgi:glycosyltransferase involved in cell wall biosynthesis